MSSAPAWHKVLEAAVAYTRQRDRAPGSAAVHERDLEHAILAWMDARAGFSPTFVLDKARRSQPKCAYKDLHAVGMCGCWGS